MSLEQLVWRTELELNETVKDYQAVTRGDGQTVRWELPARQLTSHRLYISGGDELVPDVDYTIDMADGTVVLTEPIPIGSSLVAEGKAGRFFSGDELETLVLEAFLRHTHGQNPRISFDDPPPLGYVTLPAIEKQLVAILATIDALWILTTDAAFDIDIATPEGVSIPRSQRWQHLMMQIRMLKERYQEIAQMLNVGLNRIQQYNLRRVSRLTNRLVPIYIPQEFDDRSIPPRRVRPPIDTGL